MKFIISESKLENTIFSYLDMLLDKIDFYGELYFVYKGTRNAVIYTNGEITKLSSHIIDDVLRIFSIDYNDCYRFILKWLEGKVNHNIGRLSLTPNFIYLSDFISS